jgi:hypothetical protein
LAELWATEGYYTAASKELKLYTTNRQKNSWKISERCGHISNLINEADTGTDKSPDYFSYIDEAEDFAFDQYGWTDFVLASKWTKDNIEHCTFVNAENISFSIKTKRFYHICKKAKEGDVIKFRCLIDPTNGQVTPFVAAQTQARPWSLLPLVYGVIDYDNQNKKTLHIISCNSELFFYKYMKTAYSKGDFVKFRTYRKNVSKGIIAEIADLSPCPKDEAISKFSTRLVVVDDINDAKKLFHVVLGIGETGDVIRYSDTPLRPSLGDFLHLTYYIKQNKEGVKHIMPLQIQTTEDTNEMRKTIQGYLEIKHKNDTRFAFVNHIYVHASILAKSGITNDCYVSADIVYSSDDKWRVVSLVPASCNSQ